MWRSLADFRADFRVFYRIDRIEDLDGPEFLALAYRVEAYGGAVRAAKRREVEAAVRAQRERAEHMPGPKGPGVTVVDPEVALAGGMFG